MAPAGRTAVGVERRQAAILVETETAELRGSPTVLVDSRAPFADPRAPVGMSRRVYRTGTRLAGAPAVEQVAEAMS